MSTCISRQHVKLGKLGYYQHKILKNIGHYTIWLKNILVKIPDETRQSGCKSSTQTKRLSQTQLDNARTLPHTRHIHLGEA